MLFTNFLLGQNVNGIQLNTDEAYDGYSLIMNGDGTYLIDNCGEILNEWQDVNRAYYHPKLMENGNLVYIETEFEIVQGMIVFEQKVIELDWDGNVINEVSNPEASLTSVYEVIVLPNGNYLCAARMEFSEEDFMELGYDIPGAAPDRMDGVIEMDRSTGELVWEWRASDHVIQERDPSANNYGIVADHPELINMDAVSNLDWQDGESFMINSIGYNAERDEILISMRKMCEIMILDHSTTKEEAAGHTGGRHGKGGDIIYRWGNPANYGAGTAQNQYLYYQHNPHWIKEGPYKGKIMAYSNGLFRPGIASPEDNYSTIPIISPTLDENDHYVLEPGMAYGPMEPEFEYRGDTPGGKFYSGYTSGASFLPNGNVYVTIGAEDKAFELNPQGQIVWEYNIDRGFYIYRSEKYPKDYPAFDGKELSPEGTIEFPASDYDCELFSTSTDDPLVDIEISIINQIGNTRILNPNGRLLDFKILNVLGEQLDHVTTSDTNIPIDLMHLIPNNYILVVTDRSSNTSYTYKLIKI